MKIGKLRVILGYSIMIGWGVNMTRVYYNNMENFNKSNKQIKKNKYCYNFK